MTNDCERLHLASGAWELEVQPARGGAVTALRHGGRPVLVSPDPATVDAMGAASFVLVPYANRIAQGRFSHQGRQWTLPRNFGEHAHPLHGTGWKRPWSVAAQRAQAIELQLRHNADPHWPCAFSARQNISLLADAVRFELRVTNDAAEPAPMGVGFHPAFAASAATRLRTQLEAVWLTDADGLPVSLAPADAVLPELPGAVPVLRNALVDHCFTGWSRELHIENAGAGGEIAAVELRASPGMDFLQLYTPPGKFWFCAEPMSQMPDAVNRHGGPRETGLRLLAPGESLLVWMTIAVHEACTQQP
jgi:aldose 1-epimerase